MYFLNEKYRGEVTSEEDKMPAAELKECEKALPFERKKTSTYSSRRENMIFFFSIDIVPDDVYRNHCWWNGQVLETDMLTICPSFSFLFISASLHVTWIADTEHGAVFTKQTWFRRSLAIMSQIVDPWTRGRSWTRSSSQYIAYVTAAEHGNRRNLARCHSALY